MTDKRKERFYWTISGLVIFLMLSPYPLSKLYVKWKKHQGKAYYEEFKYNYRVYCYDTTFGALNPGYYIDDLKYKQSLIRVCDSMERRKDFSIPFPIQFMPYEQPIILIGYIDHDSTIAEVIDFNTDCWGHVHGYIDTYTMHLRPPSKQKLDQAAAFWAEREKDPDHQFAKRKSWHLKHSPYGIHCDCCY